MTEAMIGVIGGSGVYQIYGLEGAEWRKVRTPWGEPSDEILFGAFAGVRMAFLPRQFIDRTFAREKSFFGEGCVAHVSLAHPTCPRLGDALEAAAKAEGINVHRGGTYLAMEGPQFSTLAESKLYREVWGCDVIGMTNMPEAKLATVAMVTDYDSWHPDHGEVDISAILATLKANTANAAKLVKRVAPALGGEREPCPHGCDRALDFAIMTAPEQRDLVLVDDLRAIAGRVL